MKRIDAKTDTEIENMPLSAVDNREHDWWVYSTAVEDHALMVECRKTGHRGYVQYPTPEEWRKAFHAPSGPYPWDDHARVTVDDSTALPFSEATVQAALERSRVR